MLRIIQKFEVKIESRQQWGSLDIGNRIARQLQGCLQKRYDTWAHLISGRLQRYVIVRSFPAMLGSQSYFLNLRSLQIAVVFPTSSFSDRCKSNNSPSIERESSLHRVGRNASRK